MSLAELSDAALMQQVALRDPVAFSELYDRYANLSYSLAMRMIGEPGGARAVVVDAFRQLWDRCDSFDQERSTVATWIIIEVHDLGVAAVQRRRARTRAEDAAYQQKTEEVNLDRAPDAEAVSERERRVTDLRRVVKDVWQSLSREQRRTLEMSFYQGYTQEEIARLTGEDVTEVALQMRLSLERLQTVVAPAQEA